MIQLNLAEGAGERLVKRNEFLVWNAVTGQTKCWIQYRLKGTSEWISLSAVLSSVNRIALESLFTVVEGSNYSFKELECRVGVCCKVVENQADGSIKTTETEEFSNAVNVVFSPESSECKLCGTAGEGALFELGTVASPKVVIKEGDVSGELPLVSKQHSMASKLKTNGRVLGLTPPSFKPIYAEALNWVGVGIEAYETKYLGYWYPRCSQYTENPATAYYYNSYDAESDCSRDIQYYYTTPDTYYYSTGNYQYSYTGAHPYWTPTTGWYDYSASSWYTTGGWADYWYTVSSSYSGSYTYRTSYTASGTYTYRTSYSYTTSRTTYSDATRNYTYRATGSYCRSYTAGRTSWYQGTSHGYTEWVTYSYRSGGRTRYAAYARDAVSYSNCRSCYTAGRTTYGSYTYNASGTYTYRRSRTTYSDRTGYKDATGNYTYTASRDATGTYSVPYSYSSSGTYWSTWSDLYWYTSSTSYSYSALSWYQGTASRTDGCYSSAAYNKPQYRYYTEYSRYQYVQSDLKSYGYYTRYTAYQYLFDSSPYAENKSYSYNYQYKTVSG